MNTDDDLIETIKLRLDMCEQDDDVFNDPDEAAFLTQVLARIRKLESQLAWQPIETAPKDRFLLLCGPSGYTTTPMVVTTGCMYSDYHAGRWIDHANDDLTDWGFTPTHWAPLTLPGTQAQPAPPEQDESVRKSWVRFSNELHRSPDASYPGMSEAFEQHFSQSFTARDWRVDSGVWAAAWKAAKHHGAKGE